MSSKYIIPKRIVLPVLTVMFILAQTISTFAISNEDVINLISGSPSLVIETYSTKPLVAMNMKAGRQGSASISLGDFEQAQNTITVKVNGDIVKFTDAQPFINSDDRTMVPIRFIAEALNANVRWINDLRTVMINKGPKEIALVIGESRAKVNGVYKPFDTKAIIKDNRTFTPLRFISETLDAEVKWVAETKTVEITTIEALKGISEGYQLANGFITKIPNVTSKLIQLNFESTGNDNYPIVDFQIKYRTGSRDSCKQVPKEEFDAQIDEARDILVQKFDEKDVNKLLDCGKTLWMKPVIVESDGDIFWNRIEDSYILSKDKSMYAVISSGYGGSTFAILVYKGNKTSDLVQLK